MTQVVDLNSAPMTDPWELVYLPTWMVDFYGIHVGEYTSSHGSVMGAEREFLGHGFKGILFEFLPRSLRL